MFGKGIVINSCVPEIVQAIFSGTTAIFSRKRLTGKCMRQFIVAVVNGYFGSSTPGAIVYIQCIYRWLYQENGIIKKTIITKRIIKVWKVRGLVNITAQEGNRIFTAVYLKLAYFLLFKIGFITFICVCLLYTSRCV